MTENKNNRSIQDSGGTAGGSGLFLFGFLLCAVSLWFFFDSVKVGTSHHGMFSGAVRGMRGGGGGGMGMMETTSMGIIFVPFFIGVIMLFYNSKLRTGWALTSIGIAIIVIEVLSRLRFHYDMKLSSLILMFVMFAAGAGLILRSYKDFALEDGLDDGRDGGPAQEASKPEPPVEE
jgi:hypothetical protein